jgi:hypothetical protein
MTFTATTRQARRRGPRRALWRLDAEGRHRRGDWPPDDRRHEPENFEVCLALLDEALARAERWYARRERTLAEFDRRCVDTVRRLREAGVVRPSMSWDRTNAAERTWVAPG